MHGPVLGLAVVDALAKEPGAAAAGELELKCDGHARIERMPLRRRQVDGGVQWHRADKFLRRDHVHVHGGRRAISDAATAAVLTARAVVPLQALWVGGGCSPSAAASTSISGVSAGAGAAAASYGDGTAAASGGSSAAAADDDGARFPLSFFVEFHSCKGSLE